MTQMDLEKAIYFLQSYHYCSWRAWLCRKLSCFLSNVWFMLIELFESIHFYLICISNFCNLPAYFEFIISKDHFLFHTIYPALIFSLIIQLPLFRLIHLSFGSVLLLLVHVLDFILLALIRRLSPFFHKVAATFFHILKLGFSISTDFLITFANTNCKCWSAMKWKITISISHQFH